MPSGPRGGGQSHHQRMPYQKRRRRQRAIGSAFRLVPVTCSARGTHPIGANRRYQAARQTQSRAGLLRAQSPADYRRTGNRKVGSLGNLMIGSSPGPACWKQGTSVRPVTHFRRRSRCRPSRFRRRCLLVSCSGNRCAARVKCSLVVQWQSRCDPWSTSRSEWRS